MEIVQTYALLWEAYHERTPPDAASPRHMRHAAVFLSLLLVATAPAPAQLQQIRSLIGSLNHALQARDAAAFSLLFAPNGDLRIGDGTFAPTISAIDQLFPHRPAWSETTIPTITSESAILVSPGIAIVEAVQIQYGSLILRQSRPVHMLLRHDGAAWRIVSLRIR